MNTKSPVSSPKVFRGDGDALVDALVEACLPSSRPSLEEPVLPHLIGRLLTPYFGSSEPVQDAAHEGKPSPSTNNKRKGSPPNLTRPRASSPTPADILAGVISSMPIGATSSKMQRSARNAPEPATTPAKASEPISVGKKKKNPTRASLDSAIATAMSTYACPGMFSSPKPETLPIPSSSILMRATHSAIAMKCVPISA